MKSVCIARYGAPEVLEIRDLPDPVAGPGQLRVRVKAAGLNFADILSRKGLYPGRPEPPFVPGLEAAGVVDAVGPGVDPAWTGRRVVAPMWFGAQAEYLLTEPADVGVLPEGRSFEQGAAFAVTYLTAWHGLVFLANVQPGDAVLVHAAAGGVGTAAVQIAKLKGATVIGTASASKHDVLRRLGADHCIDYRTQDWESEVMRLTAGRGVRVAMDPVGGDSFRKSYRCLRRAGVLLCYGLSSAVDGGGGWLRAAWEYLRSPSFPAMRLMNDNKAVIGYHMGRLIPEKRIMRQELAELGALWAQGKLEPVVDSAFPFERAAEAHRRIESRANVGKVVLTFP